MGHCFAWQKEGSCIKGDACRFEHADVSPINVKATLATDVKEQYCYRFKKKGFCAKGNACEFAHIAQTASEDGATSDIADRHRGLPLNTTILDTAALRATWKALKNGNADKAAVKEAKSKYKAAKESELQRTRAAGKRAALSFMASKDAESARKKPKLSKKERNKKAHVIRSRGIRIPGSRR